MKHRAPQEAKRRSKDDEGLFGLLLGQGELAGKRGLHKEALRFFRLAKAKAERGMNDSVLAMSLLNIGISLAQLGQTSAARDAYRKARKIAESDGLKSTLERALEAEAYLQLESKRAAEAAPLLNALAQLRCSTGDFKNAIIAMHDRGAAYFQAGKKSDAHESFNAAVSLAREHNLEEWIHRCYRDECQLVLQASGVRAALGYLRTTIAAEAALQCHQVCCHLRNEVVDLMLSQGLPSKDLQNALIECEKSWRAFPRDIPGHIRLYEIKYGVCWHLAEFDGAMKTLRQMAEYASKHKRDDAELKAVAQLGCCLTDLGRFDEAEETLRYALKLSLNRRETLTQEHVLNNLGECLRRSSDPKRAVAAFRDAEKIALARGDQESVISTAHNRALALHQCGRRRDAMRLLQWCCDSAKEQKLWHEHVRAVHGQAILSVQSNSVGDAIPRYRQALQLATKHKFDHQQAQIALNYGSLLRKQNKLRSSLRILEGTPDFVRGEPNQHKWHEELAQLYQQLGNTTKAIKHWTEAKNGSKAANDTDSMMLAYLALADIFIELRNYPEANREITEALRCGCDDFCRASFQYQRLHLNLELGHDTASNRAFKEIKRLSEQSTDAVETLIDAYMLVGDHNWLKDKNYVEAMKAYAFAFVEAAVCGETPQISAVLNHSIMQFRILAKSKSVAFLNTVEEPLQKWLTKQKASTQIKQYVLGPLRIARRFACLNMRKSTLKEVNAIIDEELKI